MEYQKDKIKRLIEYKDNIVDTQIKNDLEWIVECYNEYFIYSKEHTEERKNYKNILNKYYEAEDEKAILKEQIIILKNKYYTLKQEYNRSCKKEKNMI